MGSVLPLRRVAQTWCLAAVLLLLLASPVLVALAETMPAESPGAGPPAERLTDFVEPVIYHAQAMDRDSDRIQDHLETLVGQTHGSDENAVVPVVVTLRSPVSARDLADFQTLGGQIDYVYEYVTYGFAGSIPASRLSRFVDQAGARLSMIEHDAPLHYHLDVSTPNMRVRPTVWNTYGYAGSANQSIAILDTGIDDAHPDLGPYQDLNFSQKLVGWYDATADHAPTPEDYGEHGTHVAGIAAGTGAANTLQGAGSIETTFTYVLPDVGYGYVDYLEVMNPGTIHLRVQWSGPNAVLLRLYNPADSVVDEVLGGTAPLAIEYSTEGTSYPTGRYMVLVGNYLGPAGSPFSCVETYPYEGLNDGSDLFTGVAPNARLVGVKVFDNTGSGTLGTLIEAMDWIIANRRVYHITVASMSLSLENGATDTTLDQKADTLVQNGIVTVVSAGNDHPDFTVGSPGTAANVITVAATNDQDGITAYSSNGDTLKNEYGLIKPDVAAPGGTFDETLGSLIMSADSNDRDGGYSGLPDQNPDDYQQMGGTSMAAPHVAGLAALIIQSFEGWNWTVDEALKVKQLISMTASETQTGEGTNVPSLDRGGKDSTEGYGRVNADAAIEAATLSYSVEDEGNETLGSTPVEKKVWARQVHLQSGYAYTVNLSVPVGGDFDLYLYRGTPDSYGQPIILTKSVNASLGADETVQFIPEASGDFYLLAKWVSGDGTFNVTSAANLVRDVAITDVIPARAVAYKGDTVNITVTVHNYGGVVEHFDVTAYYNSTIIDVQSVSGLATGASETLTFEWDTSSVPSCGNYTIGAEASVIPDETDVLNNVYTDGVVRIKLQGDINGDDIVNVFDLTIVALAYGNFEGEPNYDPEADLNEDGLVDMQDLVTVARNLGNTCF